MSKHTFVMDVSVDALWDVITDYEAYPEFVDGLLAALSPAPSSPEVSAPDQAAAAAVASANQALVEPLGSIARSMRPGGESSRPRAARTVSSSGWEGSGRS